MSPTPIVTCLAQAGDIVFLAFLHLLDRAAGFLPLAKSASDVAYGL
jgi:hypothetical protein